MIDSVQFIPSRWFTPTNGRGIDPVVLHTVEGDPDKPGGGDDSAENVARYCQRRNDKVSAHWFVDDDSMVRGVLDKDVAYAAPGANRNGIQIEMCGYARWTREQWLNEHLGTLCNVSRLIAHYFKKADIPIIFRDAAALKEGHARGVTTHLQCSLAWKKSTHTDPGPGFPIAEVINLAWEFALKE